MSLNRRTVILSLGYLKLVLINLLGLGLQIKYLYPMLAHLKYGVHWPFLAMAIATLATLLVDISFCVVLLVGGHKRSRSVLRVYFWLAIVGVIVAILRTGYGVANTVATILTAPAVVVQDILHNPNVYAGIFWFGLVDIAIQITLLVFVRREIRSIESTKTEAQDAELQTVSFSTSRSLNDHLKHKFVDFKYYKVQSQPFPFKHCLKYQENCMRYGQNRKFAITLISFHIGAHSTSVLLSIDMDFVRKNMRDQRVWILVLGSIKGIIDTVPLGFAIHNLAELSKALHVMEMLQHTRTKVDIAMMTSLAFQFRTNAALTSFLVFNVLCSTFILVGSALRHRSLMRVCFWFSAFDSSQFLIAFIIFLMVVFDDILYIKYSFVYLIPYLVLQVTITILLRREYKKTETTNR